MTAEAKYGAPFAFTCRALIVAAFNALPRSADTSEGFFSRWLVVPFTGYFPPGTRTLPSGPGSPPPPSCRACSGTR